MAFLTVYPPRLVEVRDGDLWRSGASVHRCGRAGVGRPANVTRVPISAANSDVLVAIGGVEEVNVDGWHPHLWGVPVDDPRDSGVTQAAGGYVVDEALVVEDRGQRALHLLGAADRLNAAVAL